MSRFIKDIALFLAGLPLMTLRGEAGAPATTGVQPPQDLPPVALRPLNFDRDNLFAAHRSHSSHSSHASHRSHYSGTGGAPPPPPPASAPTPPRSVAPVAPAPSPSPSVGTRPSYLLGDPSTAGVAPSSDSASHLSVPDFSKVAPSTERNLGGTSAGRPAPLTLDEKRRLQIMRVQVALTSLGLYNGRVDGVLNAETKLGLEFFQDLKGLPKSGTMTTPTLNALGVPAVN